MIEQDVEEVAEAMKDNPEYWAEMYLELKKSTDTLIKQRNELVGMLNNKSKDSDTDYVLH